jgi:glyoxylase-like metal-dependent hydrolase (beta-lactamase superfamily II)
MSRGKSGGTGANTGFVDLGGSALVIDAYRLPVAAAELRAAAEQATGGPVVALINTHYHGDHVLGNQAFATGMPIISTPATRAAVANRITQQVEGLKSGIAEIETELADIRAEREACEDDAERAELDGYVVFLEAFIEAIPTLAAHPPTLTFEDRLVFYGEERTAELIATGHGHTPGDAVLWVPDAKVIFMGDLLFYGLHSWLGDSDLDGWLRALDTIDALEPEIVVPGHGPLATPAAFDLLRDYIPDMRALVDGLVEAGASAEEVAAVEVPAKYADLDEPDLFHRNVQALYTRLTSAD